MPVTSPSSTHYVLYADDDVDDLELVQDAFRNYAKEIEVVSANDGSEALHYLLALGPNDTKPCLVILDINMPVMNGKEVMKKLRSIPEYESIPIALFTTSSLPQDQGFAKNYNAAFITKPLDVNKMKDIVGEFIAGCSESVQKAAKKSSSAL